MFRVFIVSLLFTDSNSIFALKNVTFIVQSWTGAPGVAEHSCWDQSCQLKQL